MTVHPLVHPPKARPGDRVAVLSPSFAAPQHFPAVHEQAMTRLREVTGLEPVEYPTTRRQGSPEERAHDLMAAFADPSIRAVLATIGGDDQIRLLRHLDPDVVRADPKPYLGYSDNTNLLSWLWHQGISAFHGGSMQVHLGAGPRVDDEHAASLRAALLTGERLEVTEPAESEDFGVDWADPAALTQNGEREPSEPWSWHGPRRSATGRTWGGCLDVIPWIATAGHLTADLDAFDGAILLLETSEELMPAREVGHVIRSLGERGLLERCAGICVSRPPTSSFEVRRTSDERRALRREQAEVVVETTQRYAPQAVVCIGVSFGHTRPHWVLPYGGEMTLDGEQQRIFADYA